MAPSSGVTSATEVSNSKHEPVRTFHHISASADLPRTSFSALRIVVLCCVLSACSASEPIQLPPRAEVATNVPSYLITIGPAVAKFDDARAFSVSPEGSIYVVDNERGAILRLDSEGTLLGVQGGPGTSEDQFLNPRDIDASSGLFYIVADAGNGRVQKFTRDGAFVESLAIPSVTGGARILSILPSFRLSGVRTRSGESEPVIIVESPWNELILIDGVSHSVLKVDRLSESITIIGGPDSGTGHLESPVDVGVGNGIIAVVDDIRNEVVFFDEFGSYIRSWPAELEDLVALRLDRGQVWLAYSDILRVFDLRGGRIEEYSFELGAAMIDFSVEPGVIWMMTAKSLYRIDRSALGQVVSEN